MAELNVYRTNNKKYPWRAEDASGRYVDAVSKIAAINMYNVMYNMTIPNPAVRITEDEKVKLFDE